MALLGFSAGLPYYLIFSTLSAWLREAGVERTTIGFFSWIALAYSVKALWAPLVDSVPIPWLTKKLGRRRSWLLLAQLSVGGSLAGMAMTDPREGLARLAFFAVCLAFSAATQDIVIDAYRIDTGEDEEQAAMAAIYVYGYRIAMLIASAGALWIAQLAGSTVGYSYEGWRAAYLAMAGATSVGLLTTWFVPEPPAKDRPHYKNPIDWFQTAVIGPFADFFRRFGLPSLLLLAIIVTYRMPDELLAVMAQTFYIDQGFSKGEIANVTKLFGLFMTLAGLGLGGLAMARWGMRRALLLAVILASGTNLFFAVMAASPKSIYLLIGAIGFDNLAGGMATTALIAFMSAITSADWSATQYALFSSLMSLLPKFLGGFMGAYVDVAGYVVFFCSTAALGLPAVFLLMLGARKVRGVAW